MNRDSHAFTLVELMLVIAIIGILAALSIAAYQTYIVRTQVAESILSASDSKASVVSAYVGDRVPPSGRIEAGMTPDPSDSTGTYVTQLDIFNGRIDITFGNRAHPEIAGRTLSLTPYLSSDGSIAWRCGKASPPSDTALAPHLEPTVDPRYLPFSCR